LTRQDAAEGSIAMRTGAILAVHVAALVAAGHWASAQGKPAGTDDGQLAFNNACRTCHTLREGDHRLGPSLYKIIGRKAGSLLGYGYSSAMQGSDIVWDKASLDRFIANPDQAVPGHNMKPYGGITSAEQREDRGVSGGGWRRVEMSGANLPAPR
jgi:cytochrome c